MASQMELPGIAQPRILVIPSGSSAGEAESFHSMEALHAADLKPGTYELWRFGGTFHVEEVPARTRTSFKSSISRARKPRAAKLINTRKAMKGSSDGTPA